MKGIGLLKTIVVASIAVPAPAQKVAVAPKNTYESLANASMTWNASHTQLAMRVPQATIPRDLPDMKRDRTLTVITYVAPETYFVANGQLMGFEFELARKFADKHKLSLRVVRASSQARVLDLLRHGRGDVAVVHGGPTGPYPNTIGVAWSQRHPWAVRPESPQLLAALNQFFRKEYRGLFYNVVFEKYFGINGLVTQYALEQVAETGQLSPFDSVVQHVSERYGFDRRLIVAQMYEESRFDPEAISEAGATGVMQVLPRTAKQVGVRDFLQPHGSINAGIAYLAWLRDRYAGDVPDDEVIWFSLAAYNAGYGHVDDARVLAEEKGLDPNRWFDHVEKTIVMLSKTKYAKKARYGYVRGRQTKEYVRDIHARYYAYVDFGF